MSNSSTNGANVSGPCIVCGLRDYPLSMGGPGICPACDCGHSGPKVVETLKRRIQELETEVAKLKEPPPCKHERRSGWTNGSESDEWCNDCGANTKTIKAVSGVANFAICEGMRNIAMQRGSAGCQHEWRGPGEMPGRYTCGCGTVVFRSHEDAD